MMPLDRDGFPPPSDLGEFERELWTRLMPRVSPQLRVGRHNVPAAGELVRAAGYYLRLTRKLRELRTSSGGPTLDLSEAEREAARWRRTARQAAADFGLLPPARVGLALIDAEGEDVELKRIFDLDVSSAEDAAGRQRN